MKPRISQKALTMAVAVHETVKETVKKGYAWFDRPGRPFMALFLALPVFSYAIFLLAPRARDRLFLSFPDSMTKKYVGEVRYVPRKWGTERKAEAALAEMLLGPERLSSRPLLSRGTSIRSVIYRHGVLYADIGPDFVLSDAGVRDFRKELMTIELLLKRNLPSVRGVRLLVDGNTPYADDPASLSGSGEGRPGNEADTGEN